MNLSLIAICSSPFARAASVPGVICKCSVAAALVGVARGSTTISAPPRFFCSWKYCITGGIVSARLLPTSRIVSAPGISASGNGSPRSIPNALTDAAAADDMQNRPL
jgi:hypothetical protein